MGRVARELQRLVIMAVIVGLVLIAGKYYGFDRLNEEIRGRFERALREHYRGLVVSVKSARRIPGRGVEFRGVRIASPGPEGPLLAEIDEIFATCDTRLPDFLTTPPVVHNVEVQRLKLRAERLPSGQWNLTSLAPLPRCGSACAPRAVIHDASIEFVDATQDPPCAWTLRNIELTVEPERGPQSIAVGGAANGKSSPQLAPNPEPPTLRVRGSVAGDHFEKLEFDGTLDAVSGAWDLRGTIAGLEFSPRLRAALPRELSDSLAPLASVRGRTHFGFHARRQASPANRFRLLPVQFAIEGTISEGRIDDTRLPEPLTDVEAAIRFDNQGVRIDNLTAKCGATKLKLGAVRSGYDSASPLDLTVHAEQVPLDRLPVKAMPEQIQSVWQQFSPRGTVDVAGRLTFDGRRWQPNLTIDCRELSIQYEAFPYRTTDGVGSLALKPDALSVRLRMIGGGQTIHCRAELQNPGPEFTGWIEVQSEGAVAIDDKLLAAMDPAAQRVVRAFHPRGAAKIQARFYRDAAEAELHRKVTINLAECSIRHDSFRYPIDRVGGLLLLEDDAWTFRNLSGKNDSATIVGEGSWCDDPQEGRLLRLQFAATDVPLAEELRQGLSPQMQRLWANLQPRGNLDHLTVGLSYGERSQQLSLDISAQKWPPRQGSEGRTISIEPGWFRYRLENLTGSFRYQDGVLQMSNLHAVHGRTTLFGEAACRTLPDGTCRLDFTRLAADRLPVDQDLLAAIPAGMSEALGGLSLQGPLNLIGSMGITVPREEGAAPELAWDLSLDLENGRLATAEPIEHIHGSTRLIGTSGAVGVACRGELLVDSAIVRGVQLTQIEGPFWTDGSRLIFGAAADVDAKGRRPRPLSADVFGGKLAAGGELSLADDRRFQLTTNLESADLAEIARQLAPHQQGLSGKVFAAAALSGTTAGRHTWRGGGQVRLRDADIYELPVMIALFKVLSLQRADRTAFTTSDIDFRVEGEDLAFARIDFSGDAISLKGKGRMNAQREIDLKFHPLMGREERIIPLVRPIVGETGRQFLLIEVTGPLDEPHVKRTMFPRLDEQLEQLFPELAREELMEPAKPLLSLPQATLERLNILKRR
jgi:hypothetical protein